MVEGKDAEDDRKQTMSSAGFDSGITQGLAFLPTVIPLIVSASHDLWVRRTVF